MRTTTGKLGKEVCETRAKEVLRAMEEHDKSIETLRSQFSELVERLGPVMSTSGPDCDPALVNKAGNADGRLWTAIDEHTSRVRALVAWVNEVLDRLEL